MDMAVGRLPFFPIFLNSGRTWISLYGYFELSTKPSLDPDLGVLFVIPPDLDDYVPLSFLRENTCPVIDHLLRVFGCWNSNTFLYEAYSHLLPIPTAFVRSPAPRKFLSKQCFCHWVDPPYFDLVDLAAAHQWHSHYQGTVLTVPCSEKGSDHSYFFADCVLECN